MYCFLGFQSAALTTISQSEWSPYKTECICFPNQRTDKRVAADVWDIL